MTDRKDNSFHDEHKQTISQTFRVFYVILHVGVHLNVHPKQSQGQNASVVINQRGLHYSNAA